MKTKSKSQSQLTHRNTVPFAIAEKRFIDGEEGGTVLTHFLRVMSYLFHTKPNFTFSDVLNYMRPCPQPVVQTRVLFDRYYKVFEACGKLTKEPSVYDEENFVVHT